MSNTTVTVLAWLALIAHVTVGILAWRRGSAIPLVTIINFIFALSVAGYWAQRLVMALIKGLTWYGNDQVWLVYGLAVCTVSVFALTGRIAWAGLHWTIFAAQTLVCVAAVLFVSFFKINRLI
ncbi:MAG: hypothetical protein ABI852_02765 [Gemmatimonadaceae bacterium]